MVVIAFQLFIDCLAFAFDQAEIAECSFQSREADSLKLGSQSIRIQKAELICILFSLACLFESRFPVFIFTAQNKCSVLTSELFNNSPPAFIISV